MYETLGNDPVAVITDDDRVFQFTSIPRDLLIEGLSYGESNGLLLEFLYSLRLGYTSLNTYVEDLEHIEYLDDVNSVEKLGCWYHDAYGTSNLTNTERGRELVAAGKCVFVDGGALLLQGSLS